MGGGKSPLKDCLQRSKLSGKFMQLKQPRDTGAVVVERSRASVLPSCQGRSAVRIPHSAIFFDFDFGEILRRKLALSQNGWMDARASIWPVRSQQTRSAKRE